MQHRLILLPHRLPKGPWRDTALAAREDAVAAGLGTRDEHEPSNIYLDELAGIETRNGARKGNDDENA
jgi:hypothetical protein